MTKLLKISVKSLSIILEILLLLFIVFSFGIRFPAFQTFLAHQASAWLSKELNTVVQIAKVDIAFLDRVYVSGVYLEDLDQDTLAYIGSVELNINTFTWAFDDFQLDKLELKDADIRLIKKLGQEEFNYVFIQDYFSSDKPKKPREKPAPKVHLKQLVLHNVDFRYILEYRRDFEHGINFSKLDLRDIHLNIDDFIIDNENFTGLISHLSATEKSGFVLDDFTGKFALSSKKLNIADVHIETARSDIRIPELIFSYNTWKDYYDFVDNVHMDITLENTLTSMIDVAYFAPALWGMNQDVYLSGRVHDYVNQLKIQDLILETGKETVLHGNFELPDFRMDNYPLPRQEISYLQTSHADLKDFHLPLNPDGSTAFIPFPKDIHTQRILREAGLTKIRQLQLYGQPKQFTVRIREIQTGLGQISAEDGIAFHQDASGQLNYAPLGRGLAFSRVDLSKISGTTALGLTSGYLRFEGRGLSADDMQFNKLMAKMDFVEMNGYRFKNVDFKNAVVTTKDFKGKLSIQDPNAKLVFEGDVRFDEREEVDGLLTLEHFDFEELGISGFKDIHAKGALDVNVKGFHVDEISGKVQTNNFTLAKDSVSYTFNRLDVSIERSDTNDALVIDSDVLSGRVDGVLDFEQIAKAAQYELALILPLFIPEIEDENFNYTDFASFQFVITDVNSLLSVIEPLLYVAPDTRFNGIMNGGIEQYDFELNSPQIKYADKVLSGIKMFNKIDSNGIDARYSVTRFNYNDSLFYDNVLFTSMGTNASFLSKLTWGSQPKQGGEFNWYTDVKAKNDIDVRPETCYFYIEKDRWSLDNFEDIGIQPRAQFIDGKIELHDLMFVNGLQYISVDGIVSKEVDDALEVRISEFDIDIFNKIYINDYDLEGLISGNFALHSVLSNILVEGTMSIDHFALNDNLIGNIDFESTYDEFKNQLNINGEIFNPRISRTRTNKFSGDYTFAQTRDGVSKPDELDFVFNFATMDISFANAFVDEQLASNIQGIIQGDLIIKGSSSQPLLSGQLDMKNGQSKIGLLGTTYRIQGPINITNFGLTIVNMPILDQDDNAALLSASIFHDNFRQWDYNVFLDLSRDGIRRDPQNKNIPAKLERFMALNTPYQEGEIFYGKGYVTGNVNIYGTEDLVEITANIRSARGTQINFPMYGRGEIREDDFVVFINNVDSSLIVPEKKIDFTGVRLNLNIEATPDARLGIIFDDRTGDEIMASGRGRFRITLDELNDVTMAGTFEVDNGEYNFALGVVRKLFKIEPGSTVKWMGDPYEATLNVRTYYLVEANIQDVSAIFDREAEMRTNARDQIYCYLSLKDRLTQPVLEFDIEAPRATDAGRVAINRIRADEDELTRQFFSLLLMRQFQPLRGSQTAANTRGSNALNELLANQINAVLNQISGNYDLRVRMNDDDMANQSTYEVGFASSFMDDRLLISGSFGVTQMRNGAAMQGTNPLIGDVNIEYKLNRSGTFRVNVFNRSNQFTVIQQHNLGLFTQGVGIYYQESFSGWHDFQLVQHGLDLFRPQNQRRFSRLDSRLMPLPPRAPADSTEQNQDAPKEQEREERPELEKSDDQTRDLGLQNLGKREEE